jgi:uncharacterized membrane protein YidH (DUF202 family)
MSTKSGSFPFSIYSCNNACSEGTDMRRKFLVWPVTALALIGLFTVLRRFDDSVDAWAGHNAAVVLGVLLIIFAGLAIMITMVLCLGRDRQE